MKKVFFISILSIFAINELKAQGSLEATVKVGFVIGDASDFTSIKAGASLAYLFEVSDEFVVGPEIGYDNYFGKELTSGSITVKADDFGVVPIFAKARYSFSERIKAEAGAGYAVFTGDGGGEFTYKIGPVYSLARAAFAITFESISGNGGSIDTINFGATILFNK